MKMLAMNHNSTKLAFAARSDGPITIWDVRKNQADGRIPHKFKRLQKLTWGPGTVIAASHLHGFQVWHQDTLQPVYSDSESHYGGCAVSADGSRIARTTGELLQIVDCDTWSVRSLKLENKTDGDAICWNAAGTMVALATEFGIDIIDIETGSVSATLSGHKGEAQSLHWHPFEDRLVSGSKDRTVRIWDTQTGSELLTLNSHSDEVNAVAWSPDGTTLVSGSDDETAVIIDLSEMYQGQDSRTKAE